MDFINSLSSALNLRDLKAMGVYRGSKLPKNEGRLAEEAESA